MRKGMLLLVGSLGLVLSGCQAVMAPATGVLYADVKGPIGASTGTGTKEGKACARSYLGMVAMGDASIDAAKRAGGITEVSTVDHHTTNLLGIIGDFCTVVKGK